MLVSPAGWTGSATTEEFYQIRSTSDNKQTGNVISGEDPAI